MKRFRIELTSHDNIIEYSHWLMHPEEPSSWSWAVGMLICLGHRDEYIILHDLFNSTILFSGHAGNAAEILRRVPIHNRTEIY